MLYYFWKQLSYSLIMCHIATTSRKILQMSNSYRAFKLALQTVRMHVSARNVTWVTMSCQEKNCPPENFYPRIKIFSDCVKIFCPTLKIFVRLARPFLKAFSSVFSVLLSTYKCFSYYFTCFSYNLFHHIVTYMISDSFLVAQRYVMMG